MSRGIDDLLQVTHHDKHPRISFVPTFLPQQERQILQGKIAARRENRRKSCSEPAEVCVCEVVRSFSLLLS